MKLLKRITLEQFETFISICSSAQSMLFKITYFLCIFICFYYIAIFKALFVISMLCDFIPSFDALTIYNLNLQ